jgi:L-lactate dehydrogenase complex protein LldG
MTRADFLSRIHRALHRKEETIAAPPPLLEPLASWHQAELVAQFKSELEALGGKVFVVSSLIEARAQLAGIIQELGARSFIRSHDGVVDEIIQGIAIPQNDQVAEADLGISGVRCALASTGTMVLTSEAGRIASLLPMNHLALIRAEQIVPSMAEALERYTTALPTAWVQATGPSRTADIELTLSIGVHGPGVVRVIVIA